MTEAPAVFTADYYNFEYKKGLKVCRLVFEVPYEHAGLVRDVLGDPPQAGSQVRVAIARLREDAYASAPGSSNGRTPDFDSGNGGSSPSPGSNSDKPRTFTRSQRAALKLQDKDFKDWLVDTYWTGKEEIGDYDGLLKRALGIKSKSELDSNPAKGDDWDQMLASFDYRNQVRS